MFENEWSLQELIPIEEIHRKFDQVGFREFRSLRALYDYEYDIQLRFYLSLMENDVKKLPIVLRLAEVFDYKNDMDEYDETKSLINTVPDDEIVLPQKDYEMLSEEVFQNLLNDKSEFEASCDLMLQNTVPLRHVSIITDYNNKKIRASINLYEDTSDHFTDYFKQPEDPVKKTSFKGYITIDYITGNITGKSDKVLISRAIMHDRFDAGLSLEAVNMINDEASSGAVIEIMLSNDNEYLDLLFKHLMNVWYVIQLCMLHPVIKYILPKPKNKVRSEGKTKESDSRRRSVKNVRQIHIKSSHIVSELDMYAQERGYTRQTMIWYVKGHYRHYDNGSARFINGYWKGPLRDLRSANKQRERKINDYALSS
ncbi:MAG: hypothetical protein IJI83_03080 [Oscillospiraceae bacterium]|nr:hypothetical protein [Oscillospiraceae bacterium]